MPRTWAEWKHKASILDNQWRRFNATCPQAMTSKNPTAAPMHSATPTPPLHPPSAHHLPPAPSGKSATEPQPMDLDHTKSKNPPPGSVTTVTSQGTLPATAQNPVCIKCATQTPYVQKPSKQLQRL